MIEAKKADRKFYINVLCIFVMFLIIRILFIAFSSNNPISDFKTYEIISDNIFRGKGCSLNGKPVAFQSMGYSLLLGMFYKIIGSSNLIYGIILNLLISCIFYFSLLYLLKNLFGKNNKTLIVLFFISILPNYIAYINVIGSEILCAALLCISLAIEFSSISSIKKAASFGILCGLLALTKPFFMVFPIVILVADILCYKKIKASFCKAVLSIVIMAMVIAPWTIRNYQHFNSFIPVSYNGGYVLFINNNMENKNGAWMRIADIKLSEDTVSKLSKEGFIYKGTLEEELNSVRENPELETVFKEQGKDFIKKHPLIFIKLGIKRMKNTFLSGNYDINEWCLNGTAPINNFIKSWKSFNLITGYPIKLLSILAAVYSIVLLLKAIIYRIKSRQGNNYYRVLLALTALFISSTYFVYEGQPRYNFPLLFIFIIIFVDSVSILIKHCGKLTGRS